MLLFSKQNQRESAQTRAKICEKLPSVPKLLQKQFVLNFWDVKITLRHQKLVLPEAQVGRNYGTEIFQIPCQNYGAQK